MSNPWLTLPLADYEDHMNAPQVQQLGALSDLFAEALMVRRPDSVALLGVAGGNGLERINPALTRRIVGVDINPAYLDAVRDRFASLAGLELHRADLAAEMPPIAPVDLVHAALVLEHAGTDPASLTRCLNHVLSLVGEDGAFSLVLQLPSTMGQDVGVSGVTSIQNLKDHFTLIDPREINAALGERGMEPVWETQRAVLGGKSFWMGIFVRT
jgi:SAM-dependent methyltransferase